jgi:ribosomal protein S27E
MNTLINKPSICIDCINQQFCSDHGENVVVCSEEDSILKYSGIQK